MLRKMFIPTFVPNLMANLKIDHRNAKIDRLIKWSIMNIFNEPKQP